MRKRKPDKIEAGKCYRMGFFGLRTDTILYVVSITGRRQRQVHFEPIGDADPGYRIDGYTAFLRRVYSEAPTAKN